MRPGSANIRSPEVLQRFRHRYIEFDEVVRSGLELVRGDVSSVIEWLQREQLPYWRRQVRRLDEEMKTIRRQYINARYDDRRIGKHSCVDERKAFERAQRLLRKAQEKLAVTERWLIHVEHRAGKLMAPIKRLETLLDTLSPQAVGRLDHMLDRLEEYLLASPAGMMPEGPVTKEGADAPAQPDGTDPDRSAARAGE